MGELTRNKMLTVGDRVVITKWPPDCDLDGVWTIHAVRGVPADMLELNQGPQRVAALSSNVEHEGNCLAVDVGPGFMGDLGHWCFWESEYPEEGAIGPYESKAEAIAAALAYPGDGSMSYVDKLWTVEAMERRHERHRKGLLRALSPRKAITEADGVHDAWYERRPKTPDDLKNFARELLHLHQHDYGTIIHAAAALAVAAIHTVNADRRSGGITGFQAGAIAHMVTAKLLHIDGPMQRFEYRAMLYPRYAEEHNKLPRKVFEWLQAEAAKRIAEYPDPSEVDEKVLAHWRSLVDGKVPFGLALED